jgi:hypothetical protein
MKAGSAKVFCVEAQLALALQITASRVAKR